MAVQELVGDEAGEHRQQERVDQAVADTTPEQLEHEVEAVRPSRRMLGVEDVEDEEGREHDPDAEAPLPAAAEDLRYIDMLDPHVTRRGARA